MANETITAPRGFRSAGISCGIKASRKPDLGLLAADVPCRAAAVFTTNRFCGAPIVVGREHVADGRIRAIVVNSGISNVAMGKRGIADARTTCRAVARKLGIKASEVLPSSTGVIGRPLPMNKLLAGIDRIAARLSATQRGGAAFARAILTTDTRPKTAVERVRIGRTRVTIAGTAKGSGMIAPNMATMLAYLTTDAAVPKTVLRTLLRDAVEPTFNRVTVDACSSTSDTAAILASGLADNLPLTGAARRKFADALLAVCTNLARQIAADGEGATKVFDVQVTGAKTRDDAHRVARAVAESPLVKTAIHGGDPNWGRIIQAIGACGAKLVPEKVSVKIGRHVIFTRGAAARRVPLRQVEAYMRGRNVTIGVNLGQGRAGDHVISCDLTRGYIRINADYHT